MEMHDPESTNAAALAREAAVQELLETHAAEFNAVHARIRAAAGLPAQAMTDHRLSPEEIDVILRRRAA
ncbi:MAG: hypothetical protein ACRDQE_01105 [Gaiellales bacterium]